MSGPYVAVQDARRGYRMTVHATGCQHLRLSENVLPLVATTLEEAVNEAGEEDAQLGGPPADWVDVYPCARKESPAASSAAPRVTYRPCDRLAGRDYVAARYNVLLDGVKIGEATRDRQSVETAASARNLKRGPAQYRMTTVWRAEDLQGRSPSRIHYTSRVDAVVNLLEDRGMTYAEARAAAGKRGY